MDGTMSGKYAMIRLDKSRPHGVVFPPENGAHYAQEGLHFDVKGNLVEAMLTHADKSRLDMTIAKREAEAAADKARQDALKKAGLTDDEIAVANTSRIAAQTGKAGDGDVDVKAWARGDINVPWFKVRKAIMDQFARDVDNQAAAIEFLIEDGVISADQARTNKVG
jgi:hypothetical protein